MIEQDHNRLETLLRLSHRDPGHRPAFYRVLLESRVYVIGSGQSGSPEGEQRVALQQWETPDGQAVIPFFTSLEVLRESIEDEEQVLGLSGRELFGLVGDMSLYLNPRSEHGQSFTPEEVHSLLTRQLPLAPAAGEHILATGREIIVSVPKSYPATLVSALTTLFAGMSDVRTAYLAQTLDPDKREEPRLVIGLECEPGGYAGALKEAAFVVDQLEDQSLPVDFLQMREQRLAKYLREKAQPFYERRWGRKLDTSLEPGQA
ncbi:MAG: enhanced serine sensitivity protein SseB C-terminal domain-containing protein [Ectothiorhodospiraceae bacterium]|nr:enhanced serine sensitivity protein SseB C-terminal domain-containing protein [Ectothiorhodospiraceae bacterium]